jgi:Glutathione S-transferase, N-terminal domain
VTPPRPREPRVGRRGAGVASGARQAYGRSVAVRLHRCSTLWLKISPHPCWRVQKALDDAGVPYEVVPGPVRRGRRDDLRRLSGQNKYPVIEFEDGSIYRAESSEMAELIRSGRLDEKRSGAAPA